MIPDGCRLLSSLLLASVRVARRTSILGSSASGSSLDPIILNARAKGFERLSGKDERADHLGFVKSRNEFRNVEKPSGRGTPFGDKRVQNDCLQETRTRPTLFEGTS